MNFDRDKKYECTVHGVKVTSADGSFVYLPPQPWKQPEPEPVVWQNQLSVDQMVGMFCLCLLFVASGFNVGLMTVIGGIWLSVYLWRRLNQVAPVTANVVLLILLFFVSVILGLMRDSSRGGGRRW